MVKWAHFAFNVYTEVQLAKHFLKVQAGMAPVATPLVAFEVDALFEFKNFLSAGGGTS